MQIEGTNLHVGRASVVPHVDGSLTDVFVAGNDVVLVLLGRDIDVAIIIVDVVVVVESYQRGDVGLGLELLSGEIRPRDGEQAVVTAATAQTLTTHLATEGGVEHGVFDVLDILVDNLADNLVVDFYLRGGRRVGESEGRGRYLGIYLLPDAGHDVGLVDDVLADHQVVHIGHLRIDDQVGDGGYLDVDELHVVVVLVAARGELERLEPLVNHLALQGHVTAVVHSCQLQGEGTIATESLNVGLAVCLRFGHPVLCLRTVFASDAIEEGSTGLLVDRFA